MVWRPTRSLGAIFFSPTSRPLWRCFFETVVVAVAVAVAVLVLVLALVLEVVAVAVAMVYPPIGLAGAPRVVTYLCPW